MIGQKRKEIVGVITAAGKGVRLHTKTKEIQKSLLMIDDEPILVRNIKIMRDHLQVKKIYILVGYKKEQVIDALCARPDLGVDLEFVEITDVNNGLAYGILRMEKYIKDTFCVILGDEIYYNSNHYELLNFVSRSFSVVCAVKEVKHPFIIKKNYSVEIENGAIVSLVEKPKKVINNYLGCGTYVFNPCIFSAIKSTKPSPITNRVEITEVINLMAQEKGKVLPLMLKGDYINVNNIDDYNTANNILRNIEFSKKKISVIIPAWNEEASIGCVVDDFRDRVDEVLVVNNNSVDKTEIIAKSKGARVLTGSYKGYGDALKHGMDNANGDILVLVEADGSFFARDLPKMLEYLKDADMVLGTRTTKQMIEQAANMSFLLRWGNVFFAKFIELLWIHKNEPRLTDVGCTYRAIWKSSYKKIRNSLTGAGPEFSPEMIIEMMRHNERTIEIPITYSGRIGGESKFSDSLLASSKTALKMLKLTLRKKIQDIFDR